MKKFAKCWDFGKSMFYVWLKLVLFCWILNQFGYKNNWTTKMFDFSIGRFWNIQRWQLVTLPWCMNFLNETLVVFFWFAFVYRWSMKVASSKCWFLDVFHMPVSWPKVWWGQFEFVQKFAVAIIFDKFHFAVKFHLNTFRSSKELLLVPNSSKSEEMIIMFAFPNFEYWIVYELVSL